MPLIFGFGHNSFELILAVFAALHGVSVTLARLARAQSDAEVSWPGIEEALLDEHSSFPTLKARRIVPNPSPVFRRRYKSL